MSLTHGEIFRMTPHPQKPPMFSTPQQLAQRTGANTTDRFHYLQELVTEFRTTADQDAKRQVLANLANFAYDPINYDWLWQLNVVNLFLECVPDPDDKIREFGIGGLCNLCLEKRNKEYINSKPSNIASIIGCLSDDNEEIVLNATTILMFLITPASKKRNTFDNLFPLLSVCLIRLLKYSNTIPTDIVTESVKTQMRQFASSPSPRLSNLARVFLEDYFEDRDVVSSSGAGVQTC
ncbi:hypothetical protein BC937DRAFT_90807 [Endogone sp. FLAS-F59071]|nr:hypothetical protein BC937DRAFT_90807 [Endogone sp. FLAS-F59071]|eukprot:RUS16791.1 hypothetical protein BC937DRAFT_90807 [Endogone sp. FLAS-F59071]